MDAKRVREDFPLYSSSEKESVYFDNACQTLRPDLVIEKMNDYYHLYPACGGRSVHRLATQVSIEVDDAREKIGRFLGTSNADEIVFTKNCTEAINLVAKGLNLKKGDVVLTTDIEHNSNHIPWMQLQRTNGIGRGFVPTPASGTFDIEEFKRRMSKKVRVVSVVHTNNVTGTSLPIREVTEIAHDQGALVLVDGAQAAPHQKVDVERLQVDFYGISLHKMLGPSGMGVLFGRKELLNDLEPLITGGGGVAMASFDSAELLPPPDKFESGLLNYAGIIGSGAAVDYLNALGMDEVEEHERSLNTRITRRLKDNASISILPPIDPRARGSIFSFNVNGINSHDVAMILDEMAKIMIRSGMHCVHPYFASRKLDGCARASFYIYNTEEECDLFVEKVLSLVKTFSA
jgi:cysteine desulfurase/selenocysteine lyase